jgi:hypothetical protein
MIFCSFTSNKDPDPGFAITLKVKEDVGQAQDVGLLQCRPRLARQAAHQQTTFRAAFVLKGLCHEINDFCEDTTKSYQCFMYMHRWIFNHFGALLWRN